MSTIRFWAQSYYIIQHLVLHKMCKKVHDIRVAVTTHCVLMLFIESHSIVALD